MNSTDRLRAAIDRHTHSIASTIPACATLALVRLLDALPLAANADSWTDPFTGIPVPAPGANLALHLVLSSPGVANRDVDAWAGPFLAACNDLARANLVLNHIETGFMRIEASQDGFDACIAQRTAPARWRERIDDAWWSYWLERQQPLTGSSGQDRAASQASRLAHRFDLSSSLTIAGVRVGLAQQVLAALIAMTGSEAIADEPDDLASRLAARLGASPAETRLAIDALSLTPENAAWHAAVPGIAAPPIVRVSRDQVVISHRGLTSDPFRFLTRELRRRAPEEYHSAAAHRETRFRDDLYRLFHHQRFVSSPASIELRRDRGSLRTDIDAAVFDRKTGMLALFELKTNEPFARSTGELVRALENMRAASRQVAAVMDWINRHGADQILNRIDRRTARGFRVQNVQPFVLGRAVMDRDPADRRAVWATWPHLLRALDGRPIEQLGRQPIASLASRLAQIGPAVSPLDSFEPVTVGLGDVQLNVHPRRRMCES